MSDSAVQTPPPPPLKKRRAGPLRWLKRLVLLIIGVVLLVLLALGWLLGTESGLKTSVPWIERLSDQQIQLDGVEGRWLGPLSVQSVKADLPTMKLQLDALDLDIHWRKLFERQLYIDHLQAERISLYVAPSPQPPEDQGPPAHPEPFTLPLSFALPRLAVSHFELLSAPPAANDSPPTIVLDQFSAALHSDGCVHQIDNAAVQFPMGSVQLQAKIDSSAADFPLQLNAAIDAQVQAAEQNHPLKATLMAEGKLANPHLTLQAQSDDMHSDIKLAATPFEAIPLQKVWLNVTGMNPALFSPQAPRAALQLEADLKAGDGEVLSLSGPIKIVNQSPSTLDTQGIPLRQMGGQLYWSEHKTALTALDIALLGQGKIAGDLAWLPEKVGMGRVEADLKLQNIQPQSLDASLPVVQLNGQVKANGNAVHQDAKLDLSVGKANVNTQLALDFGSGSQPPVSFKAQGQMTSLNPAQLVKDVPPADLNFKFDVSGQQTEVLALNGHWQFLPSRFNGLPLEGKGVIRVQGERIHDADIHVLIAGNRVDAQGALGMAKDALNIKIDAPALEKLHADLGGSVKAEGQLRGAYAALAGQLRLDIKNLKAPGNVQVKTIDLKGDAATGLEGPLSLQVHAANVSFGDPDNVVKNADVTLKGQQTQHTLQASVATEKGDRLTLALKGALQLPDSKSPGQSDKAPTWSGVIETLQTEGRFPLKLQQPARLVAGPTKVTLQQVKLTAANYGLIALEETLWSPQQMRLKGHLKGLKIDLAEQGDNPLSLAANWDMTLAERANGVFELFRESGDLLLPDASETRLKFDALRADGKIVNNQVQLQLQANGPQLGKIEGQASVALSKSAEGVWGVNQSAPLHGKVQLNMPSIAWISAIAGPDIALNGALSADISVSGTVQKPQASGKINGKDLGVAMIEQGVQLEGGALDAMFDQQRLQLKKLEFVSSSQVKPADARIPVEQLTRKPGKLAASGEFLLNGNSGRLNFSADNYPVLQRSDRWLMLSGQGNASGGQKALQLKADFTVDGGFIGMPDTPPPALSDDVVVINETPDTAEAETENGAAMPITADIVVNMGEALYLSAFGLDTRLAGEIKIKMRENQAIQAVGSVATKGGVFRGYGQNLSIERGVVNFQGPLDNPGLNVMALRKGLEVEAGVEVFGSVRRPQIKLVSRPEVTDTEKLSWIVLGRAPTAGGGGDMALLGPAAQALLGSGVGDTFKNAGLDEFGIGQGELGSTKRKATSQVVGGGSDVTENAATSSQVLSVGKRLSKNAFLSFEQSLGGAESLVKLTYELSKRLSVVLRSGTDTSSDLYYTLSFR